MGRQSFPDCWGDRREKMHLTHTVDADKTQFRARQSMVCSYHGCWSRVHKARCWRRCRSQGPKKKQKPVYPSFPQMALSGSAWGPARLSEHRCGHRAHVPSVGQEAWLSAMPPGNNALSDLWPEKPKQGHSIDCPALMEVIQANSEFSS